jgi:hypothetical protein
MVFYYSVFFKQYCINKVTAYTFTIHILDDGACLN